MTRNQLEYQALQESRRSNLAKELETYRSNRVKEQETQRSNLAKESETNRSNVAKEVETHRSNVVDESLDKKKFTSDQWKYWIDVLGIGPNARRDFAKVFSSIAKFF